MSQSLFIFHIFRLMKAISSTLLTVNVIIGKLWKDLLFFSPQFFFKNPFSFTTLIFLIFNFLNFFTNSDIIKCLSISIYIFFYTIHTYPYIYIYTYILSISFYIFGLTAALIIKSSKKNLAYLNWYLLRYTFSISVYIFTCVGTDAHWINWHVLYTVCILIFNELFLALTAIWYLPKVCHKCCNLTLYMLLWKFGDWNNNFLSCFIKKNSDFQ